MYHYTHWTKTLRIFEPILLSNWTAQFNNLPWMYKPIEWLKVKHPLITVPKYTFKYKFYKT